MNSDFSAKEPTLGYLYQIRYGLYLLLCSGEENDTKVLIESLDDIEIIGESQNLYQTKYHLKNNVNLSDRSSDFWKTIRIWSEQINSNTVDLDNTLFNLITTQNVSQNSIILNIKNKTDISEILKKLNEIASETTNETNKSAYQAFLGLSSEKQKALIENIHIIDSSLDFDEIEKKIEKKLKFFTLPNKIQAMFNRLEGWFLNNCIQQLQDQKEFITFNELQEEIFLINDSFRDDNLPNDFPNKVLPNEEELQSYKGMNFIRQLNLVNISNRLQERAISDYYRAFNQRSLWMKDNLLNPNEDNSYDSRLIDDWERKFDLLLDKTAESLEEEKIESGKNFYEKNYVESQPTIYIRDRFKENYLLLGSYHMLSNNLKVGWHPNFKQKIKDENDDS